MKKLVILLIGITFFATSCDDETTMTDTEAPVIAISLTPADANCGPCQGTGLNISISVSDNDEIHEVDAFVQQSFMDVAQDYSNAQSARLFELDEHSHGQSFTKEASITMDTIHHSTFYLIVNASDHNGNTSSDTAKLHRHM